MKPWTEIQAVTFWILVALVRRKESCGYTTLVFSLAKELLLSRDRAWICNLKRVLCMFDRCSHPILVAAGGRLCCFPASILSILRGESRVGWRRALALLPDSGDMAEVFEGLCGGAEQVEGKHGL